MTESQQEQQHSRRSEIVIAIIGLLGILATGLFSNWDKVFHNTVQATYSGYRPTGNFETEFRYYLEISGTRAGVELMLQEIQQQIVQDLIADLLSKYPEEAKRINKFADVMAREAPTFEDINKALLPVYQKYYSLNEIQELNKFYSTDVMQGMVKKDPLIQQEAAPIQIKFLKNYMERVYKSLEDLFPEK